MAKKAYLMNQEEYLAEVVPVLKEYKDFLKKNKYFIQVNYGSLPEWSYPELEEIRRNHDKVGFLDFDFTGVWKAGNSTYTYTEVDLDEKLQKNWEKKSQGIISKKPPAAAIEKKNEYVTKLKNYFGVPFFENAIGESDLMKGNKRAVRYAIDHDIYRRLLKDGEVTPEELNAIGESAGVRIPKKLFDENAVRTENLYKEIYAKMPSINKDMLMRLVEQIKEDFKPISDYVFKRESDRYNSLALEMIGLGEVRKVVMDNAIPFYHDVFDNIESVSRRIVGKTESEIFLKGYTLRTNYKEVIDARVAAYVESLKAQFISSITFSFEKITIPLSGFERISLKEGKKGFEGEYNFRFENGSSFFFKTQGVYAGGHTIQVLHVRYLTDFLSATLADGTVLSNPSLAKIIEHFSDKAESEKLFNPYIRVSLAKSLEDVADAVYTYLKTKGATYKNVRQNAGKVDVSVSFSLDRYTPNYNSRKHKHGIYFRRDQGLEAAQYNAVLLLIEAGAPKPEASQDTNPAPETTPEPTNKEQLIADWKLLLSLEDDPVEVERINNIIIGLKQ